MQSVIRASFFFSALMAASLAFGQYDDHLMLDQAKSLYAQSAFAHGFRHGYEEGFHIGDQDLQMGRRTRALEKISEYKHGRDHYRQSFGNKSVFEKGYRQGFSKGYEDSYSGREFQAVKGGRIAALGLSRDTLDTNQRQVFDTGFTGGYEVAVKNIVRAPADREYVTQYCEKTAETNLQQREIFCQGYARGFLFGVTQNKEPDTAVVAHNEKKG